MRGSLGAGVENGPGKAHAEGGMGQTLRAPQA